MENMSYLCRKFTDMKEAKLLKKGNVLTLIGAIAGGVGGYFYWLKTGCVSGTCPITSSPVMSVIWGMLMGGLLLSMFAKKQPISNNNKQNNIN